MLYSLDVFIMHATGDWEKAQLVGEALRLRGFSYRIGEWNPKRPPLCRAAVIIATGAISEIEGGLASAVYQRIPVFAFELESYDLRGNLRGYLSEATLVKANNRSIGESLTDLALQVERRVKPSLKPSGHDRNSPTASERTIPNAPTHPPTSPQNIPNPAPISTRQFPSSPPGFQMPGSGILADAKPLRGFFSYSRVDDRAQRKALSILRERIEEQLHMQLGRRVEVWQDLNDIRVGTRWEREIQGGIRTSAFFIPVVTPNSIVSSGCAFEFKAFCEQERAIGRSDLIFPLIYVDVWRLRPEDIWNKNELRAMISERQYVDFTDFRDLPFDDTSVKQIIRRFCESIAAALQVEPS
jgi:hypothetical protein